MKTVSSPSAALLAMAVCAGLLSCGGGSSGGAPAGLVLYADADGSNIADGTRDNPTTLSNAIEARADVIVLLSTGGPFVGNFAPLEGQWLLGAGDDGSLNVVLPWGERLALNGLGQRPVVEGISEPLDPGFPLSLVSDNRVLGISIIGGSSSIAARDAARLMIEDVIMSGFDSSGIVLRDCPDAVLLNLQFDSGGSGGIFGLSVDNLILDGLVFSRYGGVNLTADGDLTVANVVGDNLTSIGLNSELGATSLENAVIGSFGLTGQRVTVSQIDSSIGSFVSADQIDIRNIRIRYDPAFTGAGIGMYVSTRVGDAVVSEVSVRDTSIDALEVGISLSVFQGGTMILSGDNNTITTAPVLCEALGDGTFVGSIIVNGANCP